ncbi:NUDIX hydrolase [Thioclava sp. SK-1]|uniref:NUDIX domain-containing protein n=1 Tax=Thioclava sp. SK-1 TaxID=1889770 RepID=UPI000826F121|nr:NUDIX hydrolase [Thioclava sp. SK-1]OCX61673.1 NUDIX hydrolase [Thioclava sp. SK-1]
MIARYGASPQTGHRYRRRPGAYAILIRDGQLLLTHQSAPQPEFQLPGGGIDPGESGIRALHREVYEETGWAIDRPRKLGAFRRFVYMPEYDMWAEKICHIYLARPVICRGAPAEPGHRAIWSTPADALSVIRNPGDRAFLKRFA